MGTSALTVCHDDVIQDHPHAYGDKMNWFRAQVKNKGSSPRVWGQVKKGKLNFGEVRIIPTRMGTSMLADILYNSL